MKHLFILEPPHPEQNHVLTGKNHCFRFQSVFFLGFLTECYPDTTSCRMLRKDAGGTSCLMYLSSLSPRLTVWLGNESTLRIIFSQNPTSLSPVRHLTSSAGEETANLSFTFFFFNLVFPLEASRIFS